MGGRLSRDGLGELTDDIRPRSAGSQIEMRDGHLPFALPGAPLDFITLDTNA
jgi:hypothetical protein